MVDYNDLKILLVEDQNTAATLVREQLATAKSFRFHLTLADRLDNALALGRRQDFDVALVDLGLPDAGDGEVFERLHQRYPELPIVILCDDDQEQRAIDLVRSGAQAYLVKGGFGPSSLANTVRYAIERQKLYKAVETTSIQAVEAGARLQTLIQHYADAIIVLDHNDIISFANPAAEELFGTSQENLIGTPFIFPLKPGKNSEIEFLGKGGMPVVVEGLTSAIEWDGYPAQLVTLRNITSRKQLERKIDAERGFLQRVIDGVMDPIMVTDLDCRVRLKNKAAGQLLAGDPGDNWPLRCHRLPDRPERPCRSGSSCSLAEARKGAVSRHIQDYRLPDGRVRHFEVEATPLKSDDGSIQGIIEASRDVTERLLAEKHLRQNQQTLQHLALHDPLTDLPNRMLFIDRLRQALAKARRNDRPLALMFLDLDRFKNVNDSLGHSCGDLFLQEIASRLGGCVRETDTVARLGGDEFVILLEDIHDNHAVSRMAQNFLNSLSRKLQVDGHDLYPTASIGISLYPNDAEDAEELMKCADAAMYLAKERGRNTYQFFSAELKSKAHEMLTLESALRQAIQQEQLRVHYQPQYSLTRRKPVGLEALVRWEHPERGLISPADFIPLAEETGLIIPIGEWVLRTACRQHKKWLDQGMRPLRLAVNLSRRQFRQNNLIEMIGEILDESGLPPELLELEITESSIMNDVENAIGTMHALREMGVHLAIDDFGSGYSSLSCLKQFPISKLKIDQSFVRDLTSVAGDAAITHAIIDLARNLKLEVVAEGIETREQMRFLKKNGCHHGQGFLFSKPLPVKKIAVLVQNWVPRFGFGRRMMPALS
ncbi:EAL domain-containing protein [Geothermobacter hydrogeniphilus]|uniref:PAS domain S-box-containing protein/diguanylate cyclase (GGDEF) domain-containing protein n=1 Tax=Geothermobacter hydrogeniphilus TaxID=1969733 RepID=A0A1X0XPS7_9BACT|nr:EAL domain-containing protein [Geothermobacter hydrogeniphilus]ORJ54905.1 hypothetical protein B5V00_15545 [Geothermobacter hydrogeniphilus]